MASLFKSNGIWLISVYSNGKPKRVRAGKAKAAANVIFSHVQMLESSLKYGTPPPPHTLDWLRNVSSKLRNRLTQIGLIEHHGRTVGDLVDYFDVRMKGKKRRTKDLHNYSCKNLTGYFDRSTALTDIKPQDAKHFQVWMSTEAKSVAEGEPKQGLATATSSRRIKHIRSMLAAAVDMDWIAKNPFSKIKPGKQSNETRSHFVSTEVSQAVIDELPTVESRAIFALYRWGGLRAMEPFYLRWVDIDWDRKSMTISAPKTEHWEGKEMRRCPLFVELQPHLESLWEQAKEGAEWVCPGFREWNNPRNSLAKIVESAIKRAEVFRWPRLFNNLRASRATEIEFQFGGKNESEWIGHGSVVAMKHYLIANAGDAWERATSGNPISETENRETPTAKINRFG